MLIAYNMLVLEIISVVLALLCLLELFALYKDNGRVRRLLSKAKQYAKKHGLYRTLRHTAGYVLRKAGLRKEKKQSKENFLSVSAVTLNPNITLDPKKVNIGFLIRGGLGDYLQHANYIHYFIEKYKCNLSIDVFVKRGLASAQAVFGYNDYFTDINSLQLIKDDSKELFQKYDLFIDISRYPDIKRRNVDRIAEKKPELFEYIFLCERFKAENNRFYKYAGITDGQSAKFELLFGKTYIQQYDVYNFLGISKGYTFPLKIREDENTYLKSVNLYGKKYITLHRGLDTSKNKESVKLWPIAYYNILTRLIKRKYKDIVLVQLGVDHERCESMEEVDLNLVGKTSLEDIKVLLKNSLCHIDGEGGFAHLRHALDGGTSIILFGSTPVDFRGYSENINLVGNGCPTWCEWVYQDWQEKCARGAKIPPCMASITPETVFKHLDDLLTKEIQYER